jgi:hypothetical protein
MKKVQWRWQMKKIILLPLMFGMALTWSVGLRADEKPRLAILPFLVERTSDPSRGAVCPVCGDIFRRGNILYGSQNILTRLLQEKMEEKGTFKVLPKETVEEAFLKSDKGQFELNPEPSSLQLGKALNADYVFVGFVFRYEERVGSALGVEKPASVGFDVHLFRIRDGKMVWKGKFDETQKSLSENLLEIGTFIKGKGTWVTAEEFSKIGMERMLKKLPRPDELEEIP